VKETNMSPPLDVRSILDAAIVREEDASRFYAQASQRVTNASVKETFARLAQEELGHKAFLQNCVKDRLLLTKLQAPPDYRVAEATEDADLSIDMKPADALALAMKKEQRAAEFYTGLANASSDAGLRSMFEDIARMELGHKARLENMFVDIGYPEAF
jgi:rubrerythrin